MEGERLGKGHVLLVQPRVSSSTPPFIPVGRVPESSELEFPVTIGLLGFLGAWLWSFVVCVLMGRRSRVPDGLSLTLMEAYQAKCQANKT